MAGWLDRHAASRVPVGASLQIPMRRLLTPTVLGLVGFFALLSLQHLAYLVRLRYITQRLRREADKHSEESLRLARGVNDRLLQSIYGLMLHLGVVIETLPENDPILKSLRIALARADDVYCEVRSTIEQTRD